MVVSTSQTGLVGLFRATDGRVGAVGNTVDDIIVIGMA